MATIPMASIKLTQDYVRRRVHIVALVYDILQLGIDIIGLIDLRPLRIAPERIVHALSRAKEGNYQLLDYPRDESDGEAFDGIRRHLLNNDWIPGDAIGLVTQLRRNFGSRIVYDLFK